jgi:HK97 family phage prohead protease
MSSEIHLRAFPTTLEASDVLPDGRRLLTGRLVPYDVKTAVLDPLPGGRFDIYEEGFRRGAFTPQVQQPRLWSKIGFIHSHEGGLGFLGPFTSLREEHDGLYGDVRILRSKVEDVEDLIESGVRELSVEFRLGRTGSTDVDENGVRWRTRAHLDRVALEPKGAYSEAQVLAFRAEMDEQQREEAEAQAAAEAERSAAMEVEEARRIVAEQEAQEREARAEAAVERKRKFDEFTARLEREAAKQRELVKEYGVTPPGVLGQRRR